MVVLSEWLQKLGHNVLVVCPPGEWLHEQLRAAGIASVEMPLHGVKPIFQLSHLAREKRIDIIHTHLTRATYIGYFAGFLARVPVISTVHVLTRDFAYRYLPKHNHWLVAVSEYLRQAIIARGYPSSRVQTIYNGTDFLEEEITCKDMNLSPHDMVTPAVSLCLRAELGLPADAELIGQFGRVDSFKGAPLLVRSIKSVVEKRKRAFFVFVGYAEPGIQQALWELAAQEGVEDRLRFMGVRDDVHRLMEAMDIITAPSLTETFGMVIIEAMASGKPVIATRAGGIPEIIEDHHTGLLVDRDPKSLSEAILFLLENSSLRKEMGNAAIIRAREHFTAQLMAQNILNYYQGVLDHCRP